MNWLLSHRADPLTREIADRHYNRQKPGTKQFVPPGRCLVLRTPTNDAFWVTSWPYAEYVKHAWAGAWVCSAFRREGGAKASELIEDALMVTRWKWPDVPALGMITFVDARKVNSDIPGYCFLRAGFRRVGQTKGGLLAFSRTKMPAAEPPLGFLL